MAGSNLIAGAVIILAGAILTVTGVGALIGVPLAILGFAVMFPNLTKWIVILAVLAFIAILFLV